MKRLFFVLITHIVATQTLFAQLEIETTVPTGFDEAINVGVGTGNFETIVKNKSGVETITGIKVTPLGGLDGLEILANATYEYNGTVYSASVTGDLIQTNGSVRLMAGEQIKFLYEKRAKCSIVPQASSGYSMQVVDDISVLGTDYSEQTNSYPVLFPGLSVIVPESPLNNKQVEYRENFSDEVTIKNEQNSGKVNSLIIRMEYNQQVLSVNKIEIQGSAGTIERNITTNNVEIRLESSDLETLGFEDGIMPANSQFKVVSYGRVEEYSATTQVKYSVDYVAFNETCQRLKNAEGIMYFQQELPNPQLSVSNILISSGNYCGNKIVIDYIIHHNGAKTPSNYLLDTRFNFSCENVEIESVTYTNTNTVLTKQNGYYMIPNLGDLDGNQIHSDYDGNEDIVLRVTASPKVPTSGFRHRIILTLNGRKIDGNSFSAGADDLVQVYDVFSYASSDATLDERKYPEGKAWFTYSFKDWPASLRFINYTVNYTPPFGTREAVIKTDDTRKETIYACQSGDITFKLEVTTDGCEQGVVITSATPQVVQRCYGTGSGCYGGSVDTAYFDKKSINTCQEVELKAKGSIEYNCNKDCPRYKSIIVNIDDITNQLPFVVTNPTLNGDDFIREYNYKGKGHSYEYAFVDSACTRIIGEKPDTNIILEHEFEFKSLVSVPNHFSQDRIDANIQVKYILLDTDDEIHDGTWTWGDALTVYDPKPKFVVWSALLYGCMNKYVEINMSEGAMDETRSIEIKEIKYPGVSDFYYKSGAVGEDYYSNESGLHIGQGETALSNFVAMSPKCVENNKNYGSKNGYIKYVDFEGTSCEETVELNREFYTAVKTTMPEITLHPTSQQQSISQTTTWTLLVENTGSTTAENVMLRLTPRKENKMTIFILRTTVDGVEIQPIQGNGNSSYITIPQAIRQNGRRTVQIEATYFNCTEDGISYIDVESAWSCETLTTQNFDKFNCGGSTVLELENMVAVLNTVETYPKEYFHLCEDIPIQLNISNIGRAELNQLGFWFDSLLIDKNYSITNNLLHWSYNGRTGFLDNADSYLSANTILSQTILYDDGGSLGGAKSIDFDFNLQLHCGANKRINAINFYVQGYTNCQAEQIKEFQFKPKFKEFQFLDSLSVQATVDNKNFEYGGIRNFTATVQNLSNVLIDSAYVTITYPNDLQYIGYDATRSTGVVDEEIIDNNDGTTTVEWKLQEGIHLAPHEQITVYYQLQAKQFCGQALEVLTQGTLLRKMRDCDGTECDFKNSTDAVTLTVTTPNPQFSATISEIESTCNGNNETYVVSGIGIESIEWSVSPETIGTLTSNGQTANMHYTGKGVATISANVVGSCETLHLNTQTTVLDKPNFNITPPNSILWKDWNELGVKAVSTEYAESNWTIPQIDTCGQYTLIYEESNECGSILESVPIEIYRCCEPEKVSMPDTLYLSYSEWGNYTLDSIKATPEGGIWDTLKTEKHGMCGEYKYKYTVTKCDSTATDSIVIIVEDCCTENPHGDLVETERSGVTTYDVEVLREYVKDNTSLIQDTDLYETYKIKMRDCDTYKYVPVVPCFKKWADINEDGRIDENDVELLIQYVK